MGDRDTRRGGASASDIVAGFYQSDTCKLCRGPLDGDSAHLCKGCGKRSKMLNAAAEQSHAEALRRERQAAIGKARGSMPERFHAVRFAADLSRRVQNTAAIAQARTAIGNAMVTLQGASGTGKTTLAAAMYNEVIERALMGDAEAYALAIGAMWTSAPAVARARREHPLGSGEAPLIVRARKATLLVVDDVGMEREHDAVSALLYERHADVLPTVVTTGFYTADLYKNYGDGIVRRLVEETQSTVIPCDLDEVSQ